MSLLTRGRSTTLSIQPILIPSERTILWLQFNHTFSSLGRAWTRISESLQESKGIKQRLTSTATFPAALYLFTKWRWKKEGTYFLLHVKVIMSLINEASLVFSVGTIIKLPFLSSALTITGFQYLFWSVFRHTRATSWRSHLYFECLLYVSKSKFIFHSLHCWCAEIQDGQSRKLARYLTIYLETVKSVCNQRRFNILDVW